MPVIDDGRAYFVRAVSYTRKMFLKSTTGDYGKKYFYSSIIKREMS
jgi:hypothetical protein